MSVPGAVDVDQGAEVEELKPNSEESRRPSTEELRTELAELRALFVELVGPVVLADGRIAELEIRRALCAEAARRGWREGYRAGYAQSEQDMERHWKEVVKPVLYGVPHSELDRRRYPPGGRLSWLLPEPGDDTPPAARKSA